METENVRKQFKTNPNVLKILSCIENSTPTTSENFMYTVICFSVSPKTKIDFVENQFFGYPGTYENYKEF